MKFSLLILRIWAETIYYHSILKFDINPDIANNQNGLCTSKTLHETSVSKLVGYIRTKHSEFKDLYSHLSRYFRALNKENADIGLPQHHVDVYSAEFDSSKLESIYRLKKEIQQLSPCDRDLNR